MPTFDRDPLAAAGAASTRAAPLVALLLATGCGTLEAAPPIATDLDGPADGFEVSDGWVNGEMYGCGWRRDNARFDDGQLTLILDDQRSRGRNYSCAEYRTREHYGYGYYETRMRVTPAEGTVSAFFTYTGEPFADPQDEIDFEFLGRDTRYVQVNYFVDGKGGHEKMIDLGFDAADGFHTYGFDWQPDAIRWYVDCKLVHEVTAAAGPLPSVPGRIYLHLWNGQGVDGWLGRFRYPGEPITATYDYVRHEPGAGNAPEGSGCAAAEAPSVQAAVTE
ncbi:MAG TPA: glycoside hydrolase family 16 protein [Geminicoccaceae bacterium]